MGKRRPGLSINISGRLIATVAKGEKCMTDATPTELIDNETVKVTEWKFKPGESTGWHRHGMDYVVIPMTTGKLLMKDSDGERTVDLINGKPYFREEGVEHDVINPSSTDDVIFIEVEMK